MRGPAAAQTRVRTHLKRAVAVLGPLLFSSVHTALAAPHRDSRILGAAGGKCSLAVAMTMPWLKHGIREASGRTSDSKQAQGDAD